MLSERLAPTHPFEGLVFDCDGTLAETMPAQLLAWRDAFGSLGAEMETDWYASRVGLGAADLVSAMEDECGIPLNYQSVLERQIRAFMALTHLIRKIEPVAEIVHAHRGKVPMAVASSGSRRLVVATLKVTGLLGEFDTIVTGDDVVRNKPAPDIYLRACSQLKVKPRDCIAYEDSRGGLDSAQAAGLRVIAVGRVGRCS